MTTENFTNQINNSNLGFQYFDNISIESNRTIITSGPIFELAEEYYFGILIYPLCIILVYILFGLTGNIIVLYIFTVKWRITKTTVFIITFAILDIINCFVNMPIEVAVLSRPFCFDIDVLCKLARCLTYITTSSHSCLLVAVAYDRYLMVCRPLRRMTLGKQYATRTRITAVIIGVLTQWPSVIIYGTFVFDVPISLPNVSVGNTSATVFVQGKTCLVTNYYYYENPTLTYAFQGVLFVGLVLIVSTLTVVYILIGKQLYISSHTDLENTENKTNLFRKGLLSALTGSVLYDRRAASVSSESTHPGRSRISTVGQLSACHARRFTTSDISCNIPLEKDQKKAASGHATTRNLQDGRSFNKSMINIYDSCSYSDGNSMIDLHVKERQHDHKMEYNYNNVIPLRSQRHQSQSDTNITSTESKDSVHSSIISVDGAQMFSTCSEKAQRLDLKELSLKRNTLIMRMVTLTYILTYLPFLVIVTLRYSNPDIPGKLARVPLIVYHVFLRSYFFSSVIRPFIYAVMNKEYRTCVLKMLHIM